MSIRYSEDFKKEVVKAYMAGDRSIHQLAVEFNVAKSSVSKWANEYREECLYTTDTTSESNDAKEIRRLNQLLNEKDAKREYHKRLEHIFELIKYVYHNNNRVIGYRAMRIFIKRYSYELSNTTMHKYMNKELNLCAVIMHSKPGYKAGKKKKSLTIS
ncbi:transposase [Eubacterium ventriosum]|uniref:transposase n=1 Tax=Eubacterium ventriosum TaxID=39496 RepID=UPI003520776A